MTHITHTQSGIQDFYAKKPAHTAVPGQVLLLPDDALPPITLLDEGTVVQYAISDEGSRIILNFFKPGAFFPANAAVNDTPARHYFEAVTLVRYRQASAAEVKTFLKANPTVAYDLLGRLYRGMDGMLDKLTAALSNSAEHRIRTELSLHAARFGTRQGADMTLPLTITSLAEQTGLARETVSREISKLRQKGLITTGRGIITLHEIEA